jgi:hypothetical protein
MTGRFEIVETAGGHAMGEPVHTRMIAANGEPIQRSGDQYVHLADARRAIVVECNCTDDFACDPPCSWVEQDLCSACAPQEADLVNHPPHYTAHPSGVECIEITEHMGFNVGNAVKYLWRADEKGNALEDLRKAAWYVDREIQRRIAGGDLP